MSFSFSFSFSLGAGLSAGTTVVADALDRLYMDELLDGKVSAKLVVDALTMRDNPLAPANPILLGDGNPRSFPKESLSRLMPMCLGLENSFILDFSLLGLCSRSAGGSVPVGCNVGWRGKTMLAAVVAT